MSEQYKFIWTAGAIKKWQSGKADPRHTISAPNIAEVYDGFVRQLRAGTPWLLVQGCTAWKGGTA